MKNTVLTKAQKQATLQKWAEWILKQRTLSASKTPKIRAAA
jgi:hypothetical protein